MFRCACNKAFVGYAPNAATSPINPAQRKAILALERVDVFIQFLLCVYLALSAEQYRRAGRCYATGVKVRVFIREGGAERRVRVQVSSNLETLPLPSPKGRGSSSSPSTGLHLIKKTLTGRLPASAGTTTSFKRFSAANRRQARYAKT